MINKLIHKCNGCGYEECLYGAITQNQMFCPKCGSKDNQSFIGEIPQYQKEIFKEARP